MKVDQLSAAIETELNAYAEGAKETVAKAVKETANDIKKEIAENAPVGATGKYKKSWRVKKTADSDTSVSFVVHANKDGYRLAHLLEFGHVKRGGGRVSPREHIKLAEEHGEKQLEEKIRGGLK